MRLERRIAEHSRRQMAVVLTPAGKKLLQQARGPDDEIIGLNIPTGIPLVYELDADLKPLRQQIRHPRAGDWLDRQAGLHH